MKTQDPDRCSAAHDMIRNGDRDVVQCQGSIHHDGAHFFGEDHYTVQWEAKPDPEEHHNIIPHAVPSADWKS